MNDSHSDWDVLGLQFLCVKRIYEIRLGEAQRAVTYVPPPASRGIEAYRRTATLALNPIDRTGA